ncbi:HBL086Cp [Eremothecium sinecaudum]|uniref:Translation initiation factor eIF2B subunit delta n=1 Tax=Eremothecium sinecaudum TaxID=45286 RepID=A0A125RDX1_9SACH|nr:HBL086Cp [Eremothecium sinecaudum]AMD18816.1 HBL086Cp [Eremothecium sinecaudum]
MSSETVSDNESEQQTQSVRQRTSVQDNKEPSVSSQSDEKKLSNKELKELKKKEKAAKRSAKKQASGITVEQQQQQAQIKREKKQLQREQQLAGNKKGKNNKSEPKYASKKSTLFGHLETTEDRRASFLAVTSAICSNGASKITATGLMLPTVATALTVNNTNITPPPGHIPVASGAPPNAIDVAAQMLANVSMDDEASFFPGTSSVIPLTLEGSLKNSQLISSVKELVANKDLLHPAIALLTSEFASYKIVGSIPRCLAMLEAFQIVIKDYKTPEGTTLSRNLTNYLSHQIDFLKKARPLSVTMGNAIRWLKQEISLIDPATSDQKAKDQLCEKIAQFAREKVELADQLILENASQHIDNNSTILTYGCSKVLTDLFIQNAVDLGKNFEIIIADSRPLFEGRKMAEQLRNKGLNVTYVLITSLATVFNMDIDYVILGAHSILSNGFLYSRVGTAMLAMSAKRRNIPVLVCCESLKFSQRVQLDSVTFNELADPNILVNISSDDPVKRHSNKGFLLQKFVKERADHLKQKDEQDIKQNANISTKVPENNTTSESEKSILADWHELPHLNIFNMLYDLTPPEYIKKVITEFGALPPSSVPVILREYKGSV